jgi:ribosomal protein S14
MYKASLRDRSKRKVGINLELKRSFIKAVYKCNLINLNLKLDFFSILNKYPRCSSFVQYNNFCNITDKSRSVFRFFGIERFILRQNILKGSFNYVKYRILR